MDYSMPDFPVLLLHGKQMGIMVTVTGFIFLGSNITADGDCSHEVKDSFSLEEKL